MQLQQPDEYCEEWATKPWSFEQLPMLPDKFRFKVVNSVKSQYFVLKKLMNDSSVTNIICATDADREGECIFRYVYNAIGCRKPVLRLWVSSLEAEAISAGIKNLQPDSYYDSLFYAGYCRARADWLVGMNFSRLFSVRYNAFLTTGRVQTPTLAMIVKRDYQVEHFQKEKYYTAELDLGSFVASSERIDDEAAAIGLAEKVNGKSAVVSDIKQEIKTIKPPKLYDLTTLQREANKYFGFTAAQTAKNLQALYEAKLTTYPRTDSQYITTDMQASAEALIPTIYSVFPLFGAVPDSFDLSSCVNNSKVTGHHAILPTQSISSTNLSDLPDAQLKILTLISSRLILTAEEPHKYQAVKALITCENEVFSATGKTIIKAGWKEKEAIIKYTIQNKQSTDNKEPVLPELEQGQRFLSTPAAVREHWTSPPVYYTEDTLLSAMEHAGAEDYDEDSEKKGLGTPATRAAIIEGLVTHQLAQRKGKQILSTEKGKNLISVVPPKVKSPKLTAEWEMKLQQIALGSYSADSFMVEIKQYVSNICSEYASADSSVSFAAKPLGKCPNCGSDVMKGKYSFYCVSKCGMSLSRVFGKELTETQLIRLLSGQTVNYTSKGKKTTVQPKIEQFRYKNKEDKVVTGYQWVVYGGKNER